MNNQTIQEFRFWCQKVLPLVYDDSLSYYEALCKIVEYLNKTIGAVNTVTDTIAAAQELLNELEHKIDTFDTEYLESVVREMIGTMIIVGITDTGYFIYYIPENWNEITFNTTGYDIMISGYDFGHLVLSY